MLQLNFMRILGLYRVMIKETKVRPSEVFKDVRTKIFQSIEFF